MEAKLSAEALSPALAYFQAQTKAEHAFQVTEAGDYVPVDAFSRRDPVVVPARTLLSQWL